MNKQDLKKIIHLDRLIQSHMNELDKLKKWSYQLKAVSYDSTKVQTSIVADPTAQTATDIVDRMQELVSRVNDEIDDLIAMKRAAEEEINRLEETDYQTVLRLRYIESMDWAVVAGTMGYSMQHVFRLHGKALTKIATFKRRVNESK